MHHFYRLIFGTAVLTTLAACGGGCGGGTASAPGALYGVAATGAALTNAAVSAKCIAGPVINGTTNATTGAFTLNLTSAHTAPCILEVTGGTPAVTLHSFATQTGLVNLTPITELIVAKAFGGDPVAAFTGFNATHGTTITTNLAAANTYVQTEVSAINANQTDKYPTSDPLTGAFVVGDASDKALDNLGAAIAAASGKTLASLTTAAASGTVGLTGIVPAPAAAAGTTCPSGQTLNPLMQCVPSGGSGGSSQNTAPALVSFSPVHGLPGDTITITGTNLSGVSKVLWTDALASTVNIVTNLAPTTGVVEATVSANTATSITMTVPSGLSAGLYNITAVYAGSSSATYFAPSSAYVAFTVNSGGSNTSTAASNPKGIILTSTYPNVATAATIAPLVGHYVMPEGLLTGGTSLINNCTLDVATDGSITLAGGGYTYTASVAGKTYYGTAQDYTLGTNTGTASMGVTAHAADFRTLVSVTVSDGNVARASAPGLDCMNTNPNQTTVGTSLTLAASVATASNLSPTEIGTYKNADNCQLVISNNGSMRFTLPVAATLASGTAWSGSANVASNAAAIDAFALLGGDHGDFTNPVYPQITAKDYILINGHTIKIDLFRSTVSYSDSDEKTLQQFSAATCNNMVKQ